MFVFSSWSLYSQCKLVKIKDDFGSGQTISSKDVTLVNVMPLVGSKKPWDLVMSFMIVDGSISISVTHQSQTHSSSLKSIYFRFQDSTVIKMETPAATGRSNEKLGYMYTFTSFFLSKEELILFATKDLLKFQASFTEFADYPLIEEDIKSKNIEKIRQDASCILEELNSAPIEKKDEKKEITNVTEYKCGYEIDKIDGFTKKRTVLTKAAPFFDLKVTGGHITFQVCGSSINGTNGLKFYLNHNYKAVAQADESALKSKLLFDQVDLLLQNDESLSLKSSEVTELFHQAVNSVWSIQLFTIENDSEWQKLKTVPLKSIRLSMNGKILSTDDIDKEYTKSIMNVINCVDVLGISKSK